MEAKSPFRIYEVESSDDELLQQEIDLLKKQISKRNAAIILDDNEERDETIGDISSALNILHLSDEDILPTAANVLTLNDAALSALHEMKRNALDQLEKNRTEQAEIKEFLENTDKTESGVSKSLIFTMCGLPFFKLPNNGISQPDNTDTCRKKTLNQISARHFIYNNLQWNAKADQTLEKIVLANAKEIAIQSMQEKFNQAKASGDITAIEEARKELSYLLGNKNIKVNRSSIDWLRVSNSLNSSISFTADECEARWRYVLDPRFNRTSWSDEETKSLVELAEKFRFQNWSKIATDLGTHRSELQCFIQCQSQELYSNVAWSEEEIKKLKSLTQGHTYGDRINWPKLYYHFDNRNHKSIRGRLYHLENNHKKGCFTSEEDKTLLTLAGKSTTLDSLSQMMPTRSKKQLHRRYVALMNEQYAFTSSEDIKLLDAIAHHGTDWSAVAKSVPDRTELELSYRYANLVALTKPYLDNVSKSNYPVFISKVLKYLWKPSRNRRRKNFKKPRSKPSEHMLTLHNMFEFGQEHVFGPRFASPRTDVDIEISANRLAVIGTMLNVTMNQNSLSLPDSSPCLDPIRGYCSTINGVAMPTLPTIWRRSFIPPNRFTLLGHRVLLSARNHLTSMATSNSIESRHVDDDGDDQIERLSAAKAKELLRSRIFALFFLPAMMAKVQKEAHLIENPVIPKGSKTKSLSKRQVKLKMQNLATARWKNANEEEMIVDQPDEVKVVNNLKNELLTEDKCKVEVVPESGALDQAQFAGAQCKAEIVAEPKLLDKRRIRDTEKLKTGVKKKEISFRCDRKRKLSGKAQPTCSKPKMIRSELASESSKRGKRNKNGIIVSTLVDRTNKREHSYVSIDSAESD